MPKAAHPTTTRTISTKTAAGTTRDREAHEPNSALLAVEAILRESYDYDPDGVLFVHPDGPKQHQPGFGQLPAFCVTSTPENRLQLRELDTYDVTYSIVQTVEAEQHECVLRACMPTVH